MAKVKQFRTRPGHRTPFPDPEMIAFWVHFIFFEDYGTAEGGDPEPGKKDPRKMGERELVLHAIQTVAETAEATRSIDSFLGVSTLEGLDYFNRDWLYPNKKEAPHGGRE